MELIWLNQAGQTLIDAGADFTLAEGRVTCTDPGLRGEFREFVAAAGREPTVWIYGAGPDVRTLVRGEAISPSKTEQGVGLLFYAMAEEGGYIWADFGKTFGLTRSEVEIVKRVVGGDTAGVIATELSIALDTVRTHIRRSYGKLGVGSREELFSKISRFRVR